jgi:hypothetical protein
MSYNKAKITLFLLLGDKMKREKVQAFFALFIATFFWASAYIFVKQLLNDVSPYMILSLRFSFAAIILIFIYNKRLLKINMEILKAGIIMGIFLFGEFFTFTVGLQYTTTSRSSLIIASYIILLPPAYLIIMRKRPSLSDIIVSFICMIGVFLILGNDLGSFHIGDIYCILCAVDYALYIVISSKYSKLYDSGILNVLQVSTTAIISIFSLFLVGDIQLSLSITDSFQLIYLTVFCTTLPFFLILYGMKYVSATTSGVLLSLESVMAAIMGIILLHESFTPNLIIGGTIIIFSFILSELLPKILRK